MVRSIERVLGGPIERRTIEGFNYSVTAARKDTEFARPPRPAMPARKPGAAKNVGRRWGTTQKTKTASSMKTSGTRW
jgi:ATP-dependent RNA helicase RhlE